MPFNLITYHREKNVLHRWILKIAYSLKTAAIQIYLFNFTLENPANHLFRRTRFGDKETRFVGYWFPS
jgi:hypothetical protein